jgi:hypothetical protein
MGRNVKKFRYVGTESDVFVYGEYYSYKDIQAVNGMVITSIRNRMTNCNQQQNGEYVITDDMLKPKQDKPFTNLAGETCIEAKRRHFPDRCETEGEKLSNKFLRRKL